MKMTAKQKKTMRELDARTKIVPDGVMQAAGLLRGRAIDGVAYQRRIRQEWETRLKRQWRLGLKRTQHAS